MDEDTKSFIKLISVFIVIGIILLLNLAQAILSVKDEEIIGSVTNVEFEKDWMVVTFDNGKTYNIDYSGVSANYVDLTDSSTLRLKLYYANFWLTPNTNNVWSIWSVIKVPE